MTTGYKTVTPIQLGNLLHALAAQELPWLSACQRRAGIPRNLPV